jgi:transposase-like protein
MYGASVARWIDPEKLRRAALLSLLPGASVDAITRETGVSASAIRRARKTLALTRDDLVLAALTANGTRAEGSIAEETLAGIASWLDYVNHDGSTAASVRADLARLAEAGRIALEGAHFRLLAPWP